MTFNICYTSNKKGDEMDKKTTKSILKIILISILFIFALWHIDIAISALFKVLRILRPVIIGFIIAFILNNFMRTNEKMFSKLFRKDSNSKLVKYFSIVFVYVIFFGIIVSVILIVVPQLIRSIDLFKDNLQGYLDKAQTYIINFANRFDFESLKKINIDDKINELLTKVSSVVPLVLKGTLGFTTSLVGTVTDIIIGFIISIYLLVGKNKLWMQFKKTTFALLDKNKAIKIIRILDKANITFSNFVKGQLTEAVILGILCFIGMTIFGFEYAFLISTLVCVTSLIPILGAFIGTIPGVFILWLVEPMKAVWFVVFIIVLQQIEGNLIYPKVVGTNVGLPALWVLLAITVGGGLYGIIGMIISVPLMSLIYEATRKKVYNTLTEKNIKIE